MRSRGAGVALALSLWGCEAPPEFPVPPGPPRAIAVDVELPVYVAGDWTVDNFTEALGIELAKYSIHIVDVKSQPVVAAVHIDLGQITFRQWQSIDVTYAAAGTATKIGSVRLPDFGMSTLDAAAQPVATIIARRVWGVAEQGR